MLPLDSPRVQGEAREGPYLCYIAVVCQEELGLRGGVKRGTATMLRLAVRQQESGDAGGCVKGVMSCQQRF